MSALSEIVATLTEADERMRRIVRNDGIDLVIEADDDVLGEELDGIGSHIVYALFLAKRLSETPRVTIREDS